MARVSTTHGSLPIQNLTCTLKIARSLPWRSKSWRMWKLFLYFFLITLHTLCCLTWCSIPVKAVHLMNNILGYVCVCAFGHLKARFAALKRAMTIIWMTCYMSFMPALFFTIFVRPVRRIWMITLYRTPWRMIQICSLPLKRTTTLQTVMSGRGKESGECWPSTLSLEKDSLRLLFF